MTRTQPVGVWWPAAALVVSLKRHPDQENVSFGVGDGIQPGRWAPGVDLDEGEVRVPFELEGP